MRSVDTLSVVAVSSAGVPPEAGTRRRPPKGSGAKTMTSLSPHVPPRGSPALQTVCTVPPEAGTRLILWSAKNPTF